MHESQIAPKLAVNRNSIVVFDRGYNDYGWFNALNNKGIWFVTQLKSSAKYRELERRLARPETGLTSDQTIQLTGKRRHRVPSSFEGWDIGRNGLVGSQHGG